MSLWQWAKERWWDRDTTKFSIKLIDDPAHVDSHSVSAPLEANKTYFRLRLAEMFLKKDVKMGSSWYPAVHSLVRFDFGNQPQFEVPNIVDPVIQGMKPRGAGDVIVRGLALTPPMPFRGGNVAINAGLVAIEGENHLRKFIGILGGFASLLNVPQLSAAIGMAEPLASGIQELFGAGKGQLRLGIKRESSAEGLKRCYIAALGAKEADVDANSLWVVEHELREGVSLTSNTPFDRFDYMLLQVEIFENRDDWNQLTYVAEPLNEVIDALSSGDEAKAKLQLQSAKRNVWKSQDLTQADRTRVVARLNEWFVQARDDLQTKGAIGRDITLQGVMRDAMPAAKALDRGEPTLEDVLNVQ